MKRRYFIKEVKRTDGSSLYYPGYYFLGFIPIRFYNKVGNYYETTDKGVAEYYLEQKRNEKKTSVKYHKF